MQGREPVVTEHLLRPQSAGEEQEDQAKKARSQGGVSSKVWGMVTKPRPPDGLRCRTGFPGAPGSGKVHRMRSRWKNVLTAAALLAFCILVGANAERPDIYGP